MYTLFWFLNETSRIFIKGRKEGIMTNSRPLFSIKFLHLRGMKLGINY
jgi:hypothetical protein